MTIAIFTLLTMTMTIFIFLVYFWSKNIFKYKKLIKNKKYDNLEQLEIRDKKIKNICFYIMGTLMIICTVLLLINGGIR